ncbi:phosphate signaling complex protein PhoU [Pelagibacterium montanilacus]|uniref:phosphate signaling complex protein PhoU n=1 Tax=Pelagibacterium montanilacus TaxID=2185280 RepID=UPI000F8C5559|nr:phosphate signaling complex protein PhoU [Pelagibacterium montanilacus]
MPTTGDHIVTSYEDELNTLAALIARAGDKAVEALADATRALVDDDAALAEATVRADKEIDALQHEIDNLAVSIIARRQPMASDLRLIISSIHVANDLERIGDMAKSMARRSIEINRGEGPARHIGSLRQMTEIAGRQIRMALDAFANRDEAGAIAVLEHDYEIDSAYVALFRELLTYMMEDPRNISVCTHLLFCGKNIERVGDHGTNIAEQAYFLATGRDLATEDDKVNRRQLKG